MEGYGRDSGFYARQIKSLGKVSGAQGAVVDEETGEAVGPIPRLDKMFAWFKRNEVKDRATIIHGDFKIDNMVRYWQCCMLYDMITQHCTIDFPSY